MIAINAALIAGKEIMKVYNSPFEVQAKKDSSPLTQADMNSHRVIASKLTLTPFPLLSEEGKKDDYFVRSGWDKLWIVDPLDGTKEFVNRNGEFTVNIALVENGKPILGVIYVPVSDTLYFSLNTIGAFKKDNASKCIKVKSLNKLKSISKNLPISQQDRPYTIVESRSHKSSDFKDHLKAIEEIKGKVELISIGSSIKLCLVAEGLADEYPRHSPTMEWDIAAGHAILNAAGFKVYKLNSDDEIKYNKSKLLNPSFIAK